VKGGGFMVNQRKSIARVFGVFLAAVLVAALSCQVWSAEAETKAETFTGSELQTFALSRADLLAKVSANAQKDTYGMAVFYNIESLTFDDIYAASETAKEDGKKIHLCFDSLINDEVTARLLMNPYLMSVSSGEMKLTIDISDKTNKAVREKFEKQFGQPVAVMKTAQTGSFGMPVVIAGKLNLGQMDKNNLYAYVYDPGANKCSQIADPLCSVDDKGFVFLTSKTGGYIIITNYNEAAKR